MLLATPVVTSQLPPDAPTSQAQQNLASTEFTSNRPGEPVTIKAREQEKDGDVFKLKGDVEIDFRDLVFRADEITYDSKSGQVTATGHLVLDGGPHDEHIEASHGEYNVKTQTGKFWDVVGTTGARFRGKNVTLTSSNPFAFTGKVVEKVSPERYVIEHGSVTSCELPKPKWTFNAGKIVVDVGGTAKLYSSNFRVKGVPILYLPYAQHPVEKLGRQSGFLIPVIGTSSVKGFLLGESFYWAINRSMDATIGGEYMSRRGWGQTGEFRARPSDNSFVDLKYFGVFDRGISNGVTVQDQGGQDVHLNAEALLPGGFRGVASVEYLSSFVFRLAFTDSFRETVNSEVKSAVFLSKTYDGYSFNLRAGRYLNFQSTENNDYVAILHLPTLDVSSVDRKLASTPLYWGFDAAAEGVSRKEPGFVSGSVGRLDVHPRIALPLFLSGWTLRPELAARETYYSEQLQTSGMVLVPVPDDFNRRALETSVEIRPPTLGRIFEKPRWGRKIKHTIEPRMVYRYTTGVENFPAIIRFDSRDILSNTNEIEYGITQRLYAKRMSGEECPATAPQPQALMPLPSKTEPGKQAPPPPPAECSTEAREIVTWELAQKYFFDPTFGGAVVNGKRNVFTTTAAFAGIAFLTEPMRFAPLVSRLRIRTSPNVDAQWEFDYDTVRGRVNASTALVQYRLGDYFIGGSHAFLLAPGEIFTSPIPTPLPAPDRFSQFRVLTGYGNPGKRGISAAANFGFDANFNFLQYAAFQTSYNWDCCGLSMEYRRFALGSVRNENQYRFAFTLANVGTFGNLKRQERIF
ncbi:MAG TPA: LPS assembly protein LptD [Terriglobales bacterium]|nr:LPS assembly protein LptD [Terriglobales bacterium]